MKSLKSRLKKHEVNISQTADWSKYDDRLMRAAERGDVEKISSTLVKKGVNPSKLDLEGRSAFHAVASKGHLECLNAILLHGVDLTAPDAAGRNALHLSAKYGHSLCLQKLLQFNCPTDNVDLQGRTALHDAAMSDCCSSVQLLCDHGASINAKDGDGRSPLALATQMCRPAICQMLIDKGADINSCDKQNKTALMLGCEYGCKEAVEVLLRNGADVSLVDSLGHDCTYYARIGDNLDILSMIRTAMENLPRGLESVRRVTSLRTKWSKQSSQEEAQMKSKEPSLDLEAENEDLRERLRKIQHEQRVLFEKVGGLQLQLSQEQMMSDDLENEKEELKSVLGAKEKELEESLRTMENLRGKLRYYEKNLSSPSSPFTNGKEEHVMKQSPVLSPESQRAVHLQARSQLRPLEVPGEGIDHRQEIETLRRFYEMAREESMKLQQELSRRSSECLTLATERDRSKAESDQQIRQLEEALRDVQKRMLDSEGKVKQMQSHFLALKDQLTQDALSGSFRAEDMQVQLVEMKEKYEGASAEVGKLRNQLRHNELLVQELRREDSRLRKECRRLQEELAACEEEKENAERRVQEVVEQLALAVTTDKFENMRCLLTNEVNEKSRSLEKTESELTKIREELESAKREKKRMDTKTEMLQKEVEETKVKNVSLSRQGEKLHSEKILLQRQIEELTGQMRSQHVPVKLHEETKRACEETIAQLSQKLSESQQRHREAELEQGKLQKQRKNIEEEILLLQASNRTREEQEKELRTLQLKVTQLEKQLNETSKKYEEEATKSHSLSRENTSMKVNYVPLTKHHQETATLTSELDNAKADMSMLTKQLENALAEKAAFCEQLEHETTVQTELRKQSEKEAAQRAELQKKIENEITEKAAMQTQIDQMKVQINTEYVERKKHEEQVSNLNKGKELSQQECLKIQAKYQQANDEVQRLQIAIQDQRKELDTLHCCITERYAPLATVEEKEQNFQATVSKLEAQLQEQLRINQEVQDKLEEQHQLNKRLQEKLDRAEHELYEERFSHKQTENTMCSQLDDLHSRLQDMETEAKEKQQALQEETLKATNKLQELQKSLSSQYIPAEQHQQLMNILDNTRVSLETELKTQTNFYKREQETVRRLEQELEMQRELSVPSTQYTQEKEALERMLSDEQQKVLKEKDARNLSDQQVIQLQEELCKTQYSLRELQASEARARAEHITVRTQLEQKVSELENTYSTYKHDAEQVAQELQTAKQKNMKLQERSNSIEGDIAQLKGRYDQSLSTIEELKTSIQLSARDLENKDNQISVLLGDVEKLKLALSKLTGDSEKNLGSLQTQIVSLQNQLDEAQHRHQEIISIYRSHLLNAVQGHMDADVQDALLQIIHMRQELVC
ncbi:uveal autoantigen with coiled-coil domains and ankyrin repeats isoform X2 [Bombina bombina]|uniref:uveal autoantigen with coiled-coil domains and ankyrin repeats isoform X2 n=1 Tax=Bombina bombina TaxID=8345 RepID=UPI00235AC654|nr:uveal autoantigen with coiled-coil domains and ankyrin repeats isoform X2 [Bombina bombina]